MEKKSNHQILINNTFYDLLHDDWYKANNHPVALLRLENEARLPWIKHSLAKRVGSYAKILDIGCGAGLLSNPLAQTGYDITGIDLSKESLLCAQKYDPSQKVKYIYGNATDLPFEDNSFDVVLAMDLLEHVENPKRVIEESSRVLKSNGLMFFHTFNKNIFSYFFIIKGVEWFVKNTPKNMHVYNLFIKPKDMLTMLKQSISIQIHGQGSGLCSLKPFFKCWSLEKFPHPFLLLCVNLFLQDIWVLQ